MINVFIHCNRKCGGMALFSGEGHGFDLGRLNLRDFSDIQMELSSRLFYI